MATVKVRIAVSVDPKGEWCATGYSNAQDEDLHSFTIDNLEHGEAHYWLTAELEIPETKEIAATLET